MEYTYEGKPMCRFRFNKHAFSFNYQFEISYDFVSSALFQSGIVKDGYVKVSDIAGYFNKLNTIEKVKAGRGTQFNKTENYKIFERYAGWEYDKVKDQVLNSGIEFNKDMCIYLHIGRLSKYDVDGLAKSMIDTFANYFLGGNDDNVVEVHLTSEIVNKQDEGFVDFLIENV